MSRDMTKPTQWVCAQRRLRSAWVSAQTDRCALSGWLRTQGFFMRTAKTLIRLGGCPSWSESSLGAYSLCWIFHVAAQISNTFCDHVTNSLLESFRTNLLSARKIGWKMVQRMSVKTNDLLYSGKWSAVEKRYCIKCDFKSYGGQVSGLRPITRLYER